MAATPSQMLSLNSDYHPFTLPNATHAGDYTLSSADHPQGFVLVFICNHCPFVKHILDRMVELAHAAMDRGLGFVAVSSNDVVSFPEDSFGNMKKLAAEKNFRFPYLYDASQEVAKAYDAACTPDIYVFNGKGKLYYRGQFDETRPMQGEATGDDLQNAINSLLNDEEPPANQIPSLGCGIKWIKE
ncbi:MAG: thioredoxin family protein [Weeksellaceae bacterium]|nr:thioredoxin family protein [Weeksellaceae bacterium]